MNDYSYQEIIEEGIYVCASCGSANINRNLIKIIKIKVTI
jgi:hypothetical protein